jgi:hypothetical protein
MDERLPKHKNISDKKINITYVLLTKNKKIINLMQRTHIYQLSLIYQSFVTPKANESGLLKSP